MASDVEVASMALLGIGSEAITSLDPPDNKPNAKTVAQFFPTARDATLREHPWNFAVKRASIAASAEAPAWEFVRAYPMPNDLIRILEVDGEDVAVNRWRVEGGSIVTDIVSPLNIRYIARIEDAEAWDPLFVEAMAAKLGAMVAEKLTGLSEIVQIQNALFVRKVQQARSMDGFEQTPFNTDDTNDYSWLFMRF